MKLSLDQFSAHLQKHAQAAVDSIDLQKVADDLAEEIRVRTRLGFGVEEQGGSQKKLKALSPRYIKQRQKMQLSSETSPSTSNLTQTGEMLDDIKASAKDEKITITFGSQFSKDKARWNQEKGRVFLNISGTQIANLTKKFTDYISKYLNQNL